MTPPTPTARAFRRGLALALPGWVDEGLVSPEAAETLRARYALGEAAGSMQRLLLLCIYMVGAALIGGGVITFVAANWSAIPQAGQAGLLIAAMLACHLAGYHLGYQRQSHPGLGHALIVIGTLVFGASIPLFGQIFLIDGHWTAGLSMWAFGAAAMAAAIGSVPLALGAIVTAVIAHAGSVMADGDPRWWVAPLLAAAGLGFGQVTGSRAVTVFTVAGVAVALLFHAGGVHGFPGVVAAAMVTALLYTTAGLLARWPAGAQTIGVLLLLAFAYIISFEQPAKEAFQGSWGSLTPPILSAMLVAVWVAMALGAAAIWGRAFAIGRLTGGPGDVIAGLCAAASAAIGLVLLAGDAAVLVIVANAALLALGAGLVWAGVRTTGRGAFWTGMIVIGAVIIGRFLEIDTSLLAKSLVFMGCGVVVIVAGLRFEKLLRHKEIAS